MEAKQAAAVVGVGEERWRRAIDGRVEWATVVRVDGEVVKVQRHYDGEKAVGDRMQAADFLQVFPYVEVI